MTDFNLSEKRKYTKKDGIFNKLRCHALDKHIVYQEEDVKEFIRKMKEKGIYASTGAIVGGWGDIAIRIKDIDALAGDKLNG